MRMQTMLVLALLAAPLCAETPRSGFLDDYPALSTDAQRPGAEVFVAPGHSLKGYDKVAIDPVLVWYAPGSKYQGIEPNELAGVTNGLRQALVDSLMPRYTVVDAVGPGVLQVRLAITNVSAQKKKRGLLGYTPVGFVVGAAKDLATEAPNIDLQAATVEAELLDADGTRLVVVLEPLVPGNSKKEALTWASIAGVLQAYGQRLRARLDADNAQ
jgi:hypothetical protein